MKKTYLNFFVVLLASLFLFVSCDDNENGPKGDFDNGVLVINEGNFNAGDGSVSFFDPATKTTTEDIFGLVNDGLALGDVVQSMTVVGDEAYIVVNNDNKVEIVNVNTFKALHTIIDVKLPRYFATASGKGYLTEWVSFGEPGRVSVVNLTTHEIVKTITTDLGAENMLVVGDKIFVSNTFTNTISVINTSTDEVVSTIEVADSPGEFVLDAQNKLWVMCGGAYQANNGALVQIDLTTEEVVKTIAFNRNMPTVLATDPSKNFLYYYAGKSVYRMATSATLAPLEPLLTENTAIGFYGLDIDSRNGIIYVGDAKGFAGDGAVFRYKLDGSFIDSFKAGRGPNGFVFN
jgi:YVTN family beta-propeller protein